MPLSHIAGLSIVVRSAIYGDHTAVVHDGFDNRRVAGSLAEDKIPSSRW